MTQPFQTLQEISVRGIILGALITVVFTASNVYLGLKVGLTFSSSIPATVISMGVLSFFSNSNILENNMVQTQASAAGTLSSIIFILPALLMIGYWQSFPFWQTMAICSAGGVLGVIFSIPLRRAMVVHSSLPYPEGVAAAEILRATHDEDSKTGGSAKEIMFGAIVSSIVTFFTSGFNVLSGSASYWIVQSKAVFQLPMGFSLALMSAGYLMGLYAGIAMLIGCIIAWFGFVPFLTWQHATTTDPASLISLAGTIWKTKVRFIGAGTLAIAAVWTLIMLLKPMIEGIKISFRSLKSEQNLLHVARTDLDMSIKSQIIVTLATVCVLFGVFYSFVQDAPISPLFAWGLVLFAVIMAFIIGFFIAAACGYMAGLIGSSNSPISGIGIIAIIIISSSLVFIGKGTTLFSTPEGIKFAMALAIFITSAVVAVASISNDNLQDLKTGFLVGATPKNQQIALLIGCIVGAIVIAPVLDILYQAYGFNGVPAPRQGMNTEDFLSAPQASLMATIAKGIFSNTLDWTMIIIGLGLGFVIIIFDTLLAKKNYTFRLPALAVGLAIYLPADINMPIIFGSFLGLFINLGITKKVKDDKALASLKQISNRKGILIASGLIVGESLMGVFLAISILISLYMGFSDAPFSLSKYIMPFFGSYFDAFRNLVSLFIFCVVGWVFYKKTLAVN